MKQEKRNNIICIILTLLALVIFYTCSYINSNFIICEEIKKKSFYYDNVLLGNSYYEMYKK